MKPANKILSVLANEIKFGDPNNENIKLVKYILECLAKEQDTKIQNDLFKKLLFNHSVLAKQLEYQKDEATRLSQIDPLTGIYNRLKFNESIKHQIEMAVRYKHYFSIIMLDIDHFKLINDKYGHDTGDMTLIALSNIVRKCLRGTDIFSRWGGEEFIILTPHTTKKNAFMMAERIRKKLCDQKYDSIPSFTVSLGVTDFQRGDILKKILKRVDELLYQAKEQGRNRTIADF